MQINSISDNSFEGKVKFDKKLTKPMIEYANKILDYPFSGTTARERIAKATYDVNVFGRTTKKTIHPKLNFSSSFKQLKDPRCLYHVSNSTYHFNTKSNIHSTNAQGAYELNNGLTKFEEYKSRHYYAYNSFGEKIKAYFNRMLGIRK